MTDQPTERRLNVTEADAMAAAARDDYQWLVDNVFIRLWRRSYVKSAPSAC